jgi:hypothetical protein
MVAARHHRLKMRSCDGVTLIPPYCRFTSISLGLGSAYSWLDLRRTDVTIRESLDE